MGGEGFRPRGLPPSTRASGRRGAGWVRPAAARARRSRPAGAGQRPRGALGGARPAPRGPKRARILAPFAASSGAPFGAAGIPRVGGGGQGYTRF